MAVHALTVFLANQKTYLPLDKMDTNLADKCIFLNENDRNSDLIFTEISS